MRRVYSGYSLSRGKGRARLAQSIVTGPGTTSLEFTQQSLLVAETG